jgi:hypothetical protein
MTDRGNQRGATRSIGAEDADLDQFVRFEGGFDLAKDFGREACITDRDDRLEVMGLRAESAPFARGELGSHGRCTLGRGAAGPGAAGL